jgi:hypothetical protein
MKEAPGCNKPHGFAAHDEPLLWIARTLWAIFQKRTKTRIGKNVGTTVEAGGFQPPDERNTLSGFSPGLTARYNDMDRISRYSNR